MCLATGACTDKAAQLQDDSLAHAQQWFALAKTGNGDETSCHGLGLLKHPAVTCTQMLEYAGRVDATSRRITGVTPRECFDSVCGEFVELNFTGFDDAGNEINETVLLKRDEGRMRTYWYRSNMLMASLRAANPEPDEDGKDPQQLAYDALVARYPSLYAFPPCYAIRPSSSNLVGDLMAKDAVDVTVVENLASQCPDTFCFALVGNKIATLCPKPN
jgi:hypothetical protein